MQFKDNKLDRATLKTFALPHFCQQFLKTYCIVGTVTYVVIFVQGALL